MTSFLRIVFSLTCAFLVLTYLGILHPAIDSLAVGRPILFWVVAGLTALLLLKRQALWFASGAVFLTAVSIGLFSFTKDKQIEGPQITLYQKNMWLLSAGPEEIVKDVLATGADIVTLQEVTVANSKALELLKATHPRQIICKWNSWDMATAIATKFPIVDGKKICLTRMGMATMKVETPFGPMWLGSVHLNWPWPRAKGTEMAQSAQAKKLLHNIWSLKEPFLIGGDFNHVSWSYRVQSFAKQIGNKRLGKKHRTYDLVPGYFSIPIDHVLVPLQWKGHVEMRPKLGSDHRGLLASFSP